MMKKVRRVGVLDSSYSSPSSSSLPPLGGGQYQQQDDARVRFKHQALLQDYEDLLRETEAKKRLLQATIEKRLKLKNEVKFLRGKFKSFSRNPSQTISGKLMKKKKKKKPSPKMASPLSRFAQPPNPINNCSVPLNDINQGARDALFDLNQVSVPNADEMEGIQVEWEPLKVEKSKRCSVDGEMLCNKDLNLPIFRDVVNSSSHVGKRKISWQDQVALRV